jgi:hypothetical protein
MIMVDKFDLNGVVASLLDTLRIRMNPLFSKNLLEHWVGLLFRAAAVARDADWWEAIPDEDDRYESVARQLEVGTRTLAAAKPREGDLMVALEKIEIGVFGLEAIHSR